MYSRAGPFCVAAIRRLTPNNPNFEPKGGHACLRSLAPWLSLFLVFMPVAAPTQAAEIRIATFNTESDDDTEPQKVAETIRSIHGVDIWGLQEVEGEDAIELYRDAAKFSGKGRWRLVLSESGRYSDPKRREDRLGILYRADLFRQVETVELHAIRSRPNGGRYGRPNWPLRGALFLRLVHRKSKLEFYVGNVHLKCCGNGLSTRAHQARLIAGWIKQADAPVILVGDFNIPIEPGATPQEVSSVDFLELTKDKTLVWVAPSNPYKTQCDPAYNSMLDQIYHSPGFLRNSATAEIQLATPDYCEQDSKGYADHRPVVGRFAFP